MVIVMMGGKKLALYLNKYLVGNVYDREEILEKYATDQSSLRLKQELVAVPANSRDLIRLLLFINTLAEKGFRIPIAIRGAGTSKVGDDLTDGLLILTENLNKVRAINIRDRLVHVEAGVTLKELNAALSLVGLTLPVKADDKATIGGLIASGVKDDWAAYYGGIENYVDRLEFAAANGQLIQTSFLSRRALKDAVAGKSFESRLYNDLAAVVAPETPSRKSRKKALKLARAAIEADAAKDKKSDLRSLAGYPGARKVQKYQGKHFDLAPFLFASEGSLGVISEVILRCELKDPEPNEMLALFPDLSQAVEFYQKVKDSRPLSAEIFDTRIFKTVDTNDPNLALSSKSKKYLVRVQYAARSQRNAAKNVAAAMKKVPASARAIRKTELNFETFTRVDTAIAAFKNQAPGYPAFMDDFGLSIEKLGEFMKNLAETEAAIEKDLIFFGSLTNQVFSVRTTLDFSTSEGKKNIFRLLSEISNLVLDAGGVLCGGSAEGRTKSIITNRRNTVEDKALYDAVNLAFDPNDILAPDIKLGATANKTIRKIRDEAFLDFIA